MGVALRGIIPNLLEHDMVTYFSNTVRYWLYDTAKLSIDLISYCDVIEILKSGETLANVYSHKDRGYKIVLSELKGFTLDNIQYGFASVYDKDYVEVIVGNRIYKCGKYGIARLTKFTGSIPEICETVHESLSYGYNFVGSIKIAEQYHVIFYSRKGLLLLDDSSVMTIFDYDSELYFPSVLSVFKFFDWIVVLVCIDMNSGKYCLLTFTQDGEFAGVYSYIEASNNIVEVSNLFKAKMSFFGG